MLKRQRILRKKSYAKRKRGSLARLNSQEMERLKKFKENCWRHTIFGTGTTDRSLDTINKIHKKDFGKIVEALKQKFPHETIKVLSEGAGESSFAMELVENKSKVKVTRTDILYRPETNMNLSPEELLKRFGKQSFHLIESTFGGLTYTTINQEKALVNIIQLLKPGGIASIASTYSYEFTSGSPVIIPKNRLRRLENVFKIIISEEVIPLTTQARELHILTIKKRQ